MKRILIAISALLLSFNVAHADVGVAGIALVKEYEGFRAEPYRCPAGVLTIGYGHVILPGENFTKISEARGSQILTKDLAKFEAIVWKYVTVDLTQNQLDALTSFVFNVGEGNFAKSTLLKKLNAGNYAGAAKEFRKWNKANGKIKAGLVARRKAEEALFLQ